MIFFANGSGSRDGDEAGEEKDVNISRSGPRDVWSAPRPSCLPLRKQTNAIFAAQPGTAAQASQPLRVAPAMPSYHRMVVPKGNAA